MKSTIKNYILNEIQKLNININNLNFKTLNFKNKQLSDMIVEYTSFLPINAKLRERIFCIEHDIQSVVLCQNCQKNAVEFNHGKYRQFCSMKCLNSSSQHKLHSEETSLKHFGVKHHSQSKQQQEKLKQKNLEKYGVEWAIQSKEVIDKCKNAIQQKLAENPNYWKERDKKSKQTKVKNGHSENWCNSEKAIQTKTDNLKKNPHYYDEAYLKRKNTCIQKYGAATNLKKAKTTREKHILENENYYAEIAEKSKNTRLKKYGNANYVNAEKCKQTKKEKYGNETYNNVAKAQQTCLKKYGVKNYFLTDTCKKKTAISNAKISYEKFILDNDLDIPLFSLDEYVVRADEHQLLRFKCKKCGYEFKSWHHDGHHRPCPKCYPNHISAAEKELVQFLQSLNISMMTNTRSCIPPYEIDIYMPDKGVAIEFDGLYWHSDISHKSQNYHLNKTQMCEEKGIQLIHVFENEWKMRQSIVKSRLKNLLGIYDKVIYARKCQIREVDSCISKDFQKENHLQGSVNAKVSLGLFYNDELVSLMTFGKCRFDKKHEWEMLRFCNKLGHHVIGGAGKLLKYFERNYLPKSLVSYADRRWSQGKLYEALGFKLDHVSKPNYWYWKSLELHSRIKFQKHKLKNLLEKFNPVLSEYQNMKENGYHRIYDCGNLVFEKVYNS